MNESCHSALHLRAPSKSGPPAMPALQHSASCMARAGCVPPIVNEVLGSAGRPLDPSTRAFMEPRFGHDFSRVRVHTDAQAAASARQVNALAYTVGPHMVFSAGGHAPDTEAGRRLLAHELAHVVQQGGVQPRRGQAAGVEPAGQKTGPARTCSASLALGGPGDASEKEADAAAGSVVGHGRPAALHAFGPALMRQQAEDPAARRLRLQAASRMRVAAARFSRALSGRLAWGFERIGAQGNQMMVGSVSVVESMANRQRRLTRLMNDLVRFSIVLESGPVPASWSNPSVSMPAGTFEGASVSATTIVSFGSGPEWEEALHFYTNWQLGRGQDAGPLTINLAYIPDAPLPTPVPAIPRASISTSGVATGIYIVVPDPVNEPLEYYRLSPYGHYWNTPGQIAEVWHDSLGYYYFDRGRRHYLPEEP